LTLYDDGSKMDMSHNCHIGDKQIIIENFKGGKLWRGIESLRIGDCIHC